MELIYDRNLKIWLAFFVSLVYVFSSWKSDIKPIIKQNINQTKEMRSSAIKEQSNQKSSSISSKGRNVYSSYMGPRNTAMVKGCLMKFICEIHAMPFGHEFETELEKDIINVFSSNSKIVEDPTSPIYPYQVAAHVGKLSSGFFPTPCHALYSTCSLTSKEMIKFTAGIKSKFSMS